MLKLFDGKLKMMKDKHKNFILDFSGWTTTIAEDKRKVRELETRLAAIEE